MEITFLSSTAEGALSSALLLPVFPHHNEPFSPWEFLLGPAIPAAVHHRPWAKPPKDNATMNGMAVAAAPELAVASFCLSNKTAMHQKN